MRVLFLCALLLSGCASADPVPTSSCPPISGAVTPDGIVSPPPVSPSVEPAVPLTNCIEQALLQIAARLPDERTSERTRAKAAYDYVIENTWFGPPVGLTVWQIRGEAKPPDYLENRALSPLLFGIGACEDYAAALTLLLRQLGLSARYVPGLTVSVEGAFV
ncbi:MAG: transglutaminase domain-containing protein, partial [Oscillospiraceae bacterium]